MKDYHLILREAREKRGTSQGQLAQTLGTSQAFISQIECGRKNPSIDMLIRMCQALDIRLFPDEE